MAAQALDQVAAPDDDAGLRPAEELVAGKAHEIRAGAQALRWSRLVADRRERSGAQVVDERELVRTRDLREVAMGSSEKPTTRKLDW